MHHGQANSSAFAGSLGGKERLHRAPQRHLIHSSARITHGKADVGSRFQLAAVTRAQDFLPRRDDDLATVRHGVARVNGQIEEHHFELICVTQHGLAYEWKVGLDGN